MKGKVGTFIFTFVIYCTIFLTWNNWNITSKQIAEMIFIGTLASLFTALVMYPLRRVLANRLRKK